MLEEIVSNPTFRGVVALLGAAGAFVALLAGLLRIQAFIRSKIADAEAARLRKKLRNTTNNASFSKQEIAKALVNYIEPDGSSTDPSNLIDVRYFLEVRESLMKTVDRFVRSDSEYKHVLILADSGMGKTTFCLNYFSYLQKQKNFRDYDCAVVPLGRANAIEQIKNIPHPTDTIIILDAFDEDVEAQHNAGPRLQQLMEATADFLAIIVTCRSQFFPSDALLPRDTGVPVARPRKAGEFGEYPFRRLYLLPFSTEQIDKYVRKNFNWWSVGGLAGRRKATKIISDIPELSVRPMLLSLVPDIIKKGVKISELYDLYKFMIDQWLERERSWIKPDELMSASKELAVYIYTRKMSDRGERITSQEMSYILGAASILVTNPDFLKSRSLLNRDAEGRWKFAHRSIMEFLFVISAIEGDERCFEVMWTDLMRDLFVSWGSTSDGISKPDLAKNILSKDLLKLGLSPLGTNLPTPRRMRAGVLSADRLLQTNVRARKIPLNWRGDAIRYVRKGGKIEILDLQYDLRWQIADTFDIKDRSDLSVYSSPYGQASRMERRTGFRLPSASELISLLEAEKAFGLGEFVDRRLPYWLGDEAGPGRPIVAMLSDTPVSDELLRLVGRKPAGAERATGVIFYEVTQRVRRSGNRNSFHAATLFVMDGTAEAFRMSAMNWSEFLDQVLLRQEAKKLEEETLA